MKRLRYTIAALTLAAAAATGTVLADVAIAPPDTTWGAEATTPAPVVPSVDADATVTVVTPLDTTWG